MGKQKINLSLKEQQLLDYIEEKKDNITASLIKSELGEEYIGALGRLLRLELIEGEKKMLQTKDPLDPYSRKWTKVYTIKEEKEKK